MFGVKVCFYIFHIVQSLTNAWLFVKHVWENTIQFIRKSAFMPYGH